jgi:hypothetical protein
MEHNNAITHYVFNFCFGLYELGSICLRASAGQLTGTGKD